MFFRNYFIGLCALLLLSVSFATTAHAQENWRVWENFGGSAVCPGGINGFRTKGSYGREHMESCSEGSIMVGTEDELWYTGITSNIGDNEVICESGYVTRFNCDNDYCGSVRVKCAYNNKGTPESALYDHRWLPRGQSEEAGSATGDSNYLFFPDEVEGDANVVLVGLRCRTGGSGYDHCDTLEFYVAKVGVKPEPEVVYSQGTGFWRTFCPAGIGCDRVISSTVSTSGSTSTLTQKEQANSISAALSVGAKVGGDEFGGSVQTTSTLTTSNSSSLVNAVTITENWGNSLTLTNTFKVNYQDVDVYKTWQWVFKVPASDGSHAIVETMITTCTSTPAYPTYLPGSPETVANPCLKKRVK